MWSFGYFRRLADVKREKLSFWDNEAQLGEEISGTNARDMVNESNHKVVKVQPHGK